MTMTMTMHQMISAMIQISGNLFWLPFLYSLFFVGVLSRYICMKVYRCSNRQKFCSGMVIFRFSVCFLLANGRGNFSYVVTKGCPYSLYALP